MPPRYFEQGFAALDPKWSGGRPRKFGSVALEQGFAALEQAHDVE